MAVQRGGTARETDLLGSSKCACHEGALHPPPPGKCSAGCLQDPGGHSAPRDQVGRIEVSALRGCVDKQVLRSSLRSPMLGSS